MKRLIVLLAIFSQLANLYCQEYIPAEKEAAESLFEFTVGDDEVEFFLMGSWVTNLAGGIHYTFSSGSGAQIPGTVPGILNGLLFTNTPDLTMSIYYMDKYFFETTFGEDYKFQEYILGYKGGEDDFLKEIIIGNADIGSMKLPFLTIPEAGKTSLGVKLIMESDKTSHLVLGRSDNFGWIDETYIGYSRINRNYIPAADYKRGQYFLLPDTDVENLEVYIGDSSGLYTGSDGVTYRPVLINEIEFSASDGWIFITEELNKPIAVYYTKSGTEVGDPGYVGTYQVNQNDIDPAGATEPFSWIININGQPSTNLQTTINGNDCLQLFRPGEISRFEHFGVYEVFEKIPELATENKTEFVQNGKTNGQELDFFNINATTYIFFPQGSGFREITSRYPIYDTSDIYPFSPEKNDQPYSLSIVTLSAQNNMMIQGEIISSSLIIKKNGQITYDYHLEGYEIIFNSPLSDSDIIELRYQLKNGAEKLGYLTMGFLNEFRLSDKDNMYLAGGLQWNRGSTGFSETGYQNPGSFTLTGGYSHESENFSLSIDGGVSFSNPDTTGLYEIAGMNNDSGILPITSGRIAPGSVPSLALGTILPLTTNRGRLIFRDYYSEAPNGVRVLNPYNTLPAPAAASYTDGSPTGPYLAGGGTFVPGNLLVCEYELDADEWTGGSIYTGNIHLLKSSEYISFFMMNEGWVSGIEVYLQIGALSEDSDGDGTLDEELSVYSSGYDFNHEGLTLKFGSNDLYGDYLHSEDVNGNSLLDQEIDSAVITKLITPSADGIWENVEITFTEAERELLSYSPAIRIIICNENAGTETGRLLVGNIRFSGSSTEIESSASESRVYQVNDTDGELLAAYPANAFFTGRANGYINAEWDSAADITLTTAVSPVIPDTYKKHGFFIRNNMPSESLQLRVSASGSGSEIFSYVFTLPADSLWHNPEYNFKTDTITLNGIEITGSSSSNLNQSEIDTIVIRTVIPPIFDGSISIDEYYFAESDPEISAGVTENMTWKIPQASILVNDFPVLDKLTVGQKTTFTGRNFSPGFYNAPPSPDFRSATGLSAVVLGVESEINADIRYSGGTWNADGNQSFKLPIGDVFHIKDTYGTYGTAPREAKHNLEIKAVIPQAAEISSVHSSAAGGQEFSQAWSLDFKSGWKPPFSFNLNNKWQNSGSDSASIVSGYFQGMGELYPLLIPRYPGISGRFYDFQTDFNLDLNNISFSLDPGFSINSPQALSNSSNINGSTSLSIPIKIAPDSPNPLNLKFEYIRKISVKQDSVSTRLSEDMLELGKSIFSQDFYFLEIPFYEFFTIPGIILQGTENEKTYNPEIRFSMDRRFGSYLYDIILPSQFSVSFRRNYRINDVLSSDKYIINASAGTSAVNLFGKSGVYSIFSFYKSDEFNNRFKWSSQIADSIHSFSWLLTSQAKLFFNKKDIFFAENSLEKKTDDSIIEKISLRFQWQRLFEAELSLPFLKKFDQNRFLIHNETVSYSYNKGPDQSKWSIIAGHSTEFKAGDALKLSVYVKTGFQTVNYHFEDFTNSLHTIAVEGGFTGKLAF